MGLLSDKGKQKRPSDKPAAAPAATEEAPVQAEVQADPLADVAVASAEDFAALAESPKDEAPLSKKDETPPAPPTADPPRVRVRVLEPGKLMLGGCLQRFKVGSVLDANHYDPSDWRLILGVVRTETVTD
jgi:hypothetical protein